MPVVYFVAIIIGCFHGECTRFESAPYSKDISMEFCQKMLHHTFVQQFGPYYDNIINFEKDKPEDLSIIYAGCDKTNRTPDIDNEWKIIPDVDNDLIPNQNDLRWQQQKGSEI